jgi:valyl-tRNA synthetase
MSKSKGNVITPAALIEEHGADGLRYWSCRAAPGVDTAIDAGQMRVGRRLAIKLLNVTKFVLGLQGGETSAADVSEPIDRSVLGQLAAVADAATASFDGYQYQQALDAAESFFWRFCDDYVELVKARAYDDGPGSASARAALLIALSALQRLLAPFLPFAAEEAWSWSHDDSVHRAPWPTGDELRAVAGAASPEVLDVARGVLGEVRKVKSEAKRGMRTPVTRLVVADTDARLATLREAEGDVRAAGVVEALEVVPADEPRVTVELG